MKKLIVFFAISSVFLFACKPEEVKPKDLTPVLPTIQTLTDKMSPAKQVYTFLNENGITITGGKGTKITIAPYTYGNNPGDILIELREVYNKREMIGAGIFTETLDGRMLNSLGMFEVRAYGKGAMLQPLKDAVISMAIGSSETPQNTKVFELRTFTDSISGESFSKWVEYDENWTMDSMQKRAIFNFNLVNWCNLDKYIDRNATDNTIKIFPPSGFGSTNTVAYFTMNSVNGLASLFINNMDKNFYTLRIRNGLSGTIVLIALKENIYYKKVLNVSFTNAAQNIIVSQMDISTQSEIEGVLQSF